MADHGFNLVTRHALQQAGADRHQGRVFKSTRGKGIGIALKDADLGHADASLVGKLAHGLDNPGFIGILRLVDDAHTRGPFGHGLADQQRDDGAPKTHDQGKAQQGAQIEAIGSQKAVDAQQAGHNTQHRHHQHIGQHKQQNSLHGHLS